MPGWTRARVGVVSGRRIGIGLIGMGDIAVRGHLPAITREARAELVAVCDPDAERLASAPPGARRYADAETLLAAEELDAVVVATPPDVTARLAQSCLERGLYVLAEKPLGLSKADTLEVAAVPGAHERLQIGFTYRHHPAIDRLREAIAGDELGRPLLVQNTIADEPYDLADEEALARRLRSLERNPPAISDGIHACDRLNFLFDARPTAVDAWALRSDPDFGHANVNGAVLTYADGTRARVEVVWMLPVLPPPQLVVTGPGGRAIVDPPTFDLQLDFADGRREHHPPPGGKTEVCFALQLERFLESCVAGVPPEPGIDAAIAAIELAERMAAPAAEVVRSPA